MSEFIEKIVDGIPFDGVKTYIGGLLLLLFGIGGMFGLCECDEPVLLIGNGLGLIGIRHALTKSNIEAIVALAPQVIALIQEIRGRQLNPDLEPQVDDIPVDKDT